MITAYRDHGHALARGVSARSAMAELLGKVTGCSRGKGGSMHFFDVEKGFLGGHPIVADFDIPRPPVWLSRSSIAARIALRVLFRRCAINQGVVHERSTWLPCGSCRSFTSSRTTFMPWERRWNARRRCSTCCSAGRRPTDSRRHDQRQRHRADGQDHGRSGQAAPGRRGPSFIEPQTYRYKGHSISDPGKYRLREEIDSEL